MTSESDYLAKKNPRTLDETKKLLALRLQADDTKPDAQLTIVYETSGHFRRVLARGLTGADIAGLIEPGALEKRMRDKLRFFVIKRIATETHTGAVWSPRSECRLCDQNWLTADLWERHVPGCIAVDPEKLAEADRQKHHQAMKVAS